MKKYYSLIGAEIPIEPWVITYADHPPELPAVTHSSRIISAFRWPLLYHHQIPSRLLNTDPGFPILLRSEEKQTPLPHWIFNPVLPGTTDFSGRYLINTLPREKYETVLFVCTRSQTANWEELISLCPGTKHCWIWLGDNDEVKPAFPSEHEVALLDIIYFKNVVPDQVVDLHFGHLDTYGPIHVYCLRNGAYLHNACAVPGPNIMIKNRLSLLGNANVIIY